MTSPSQSKETIIDLKRINSELYQIKERILPGWVKGSINQAQRDILRAIDDLHYTIR